MEKRANKIPPDPAPGDALAKADDGNDLMLIVQKAHRMLTHMLFVQTNLYIPDAGLFKSSQ